MPNFHNSKAQTARRVKRKRRNRDKRIANSNIVFVGDWALAQDSEGRLVAHNTATGERKAI